MSLHPPEVTSVLVRIRGRHQHCWKDGACGTSVLRKDIVLEDPTPLLNEVNLNCTAVQAKADQFRQITTTDMQGHAEKWVKRYCELVGEKHQH